MELFYPNTNVRGKEYGRGQPKGRNAHEANQGIWKAPDPAENDFHGDYEAWLNNEDPIEYLAHIDNDLEYLPEALARELHEVFATHRENRAKLARAVKARGFFVKSGKGAKGKGKGKTTSTSSSSTSKGAPPKGFNKGKSRGRGGRARRMTLEELKSVTTCADCGEMGHWKGDSMCKNPKKAHETQHFDGETEEDETGYYDDWYHPEGNWDDENWYDNYMDHLQERQSWATTRTYMLWRSARTISRRSSRTWTTTRRSEWRVASTP